MKLILLGAPGSGKGTQADFITKRYNIPHISTGDIFRENIKNKTAIGLEIKDLIDAGHFCPDELTIEIVKERLNRSDCKNGYILDGFPRNLNQAKALEGFSSPDVVLNLEVELDEVERRLTGRRVCEKCKASYHTDVIGETKVCPNCGGKIIVRDDDNLESVKKRLQIYEEQTKPLIEFYKAREVLKVVSCETDKKETSEQIAEISKKIEKALG